MKNIKLKPLFQMLNLTPKKNEIMIKPEWSFMLDKKYNQHENLTAWQCVCGALNSMLRDKCGKCGEIKKVKKYY